MWGHTVLPGIQNKVLHLINNRTKAFCSISEMSFVLDKGGPNLNFDILFFSFGLKLPELRELQDKNACTQPWNQRVPWILPSYAVSVPFYWQKFYLQV